MRIVSHISDLHFGRVDPAVAEGLLVDLREMRPHLVVASGDFTQRARVGQYRKAAEFLRQLPAPWLAIPGNHDIPLYNLVRRFFFPLARYQRYITSDLRPVYRDEELLVVGLNTARPFAWSWQGFWKDGRISAEQLLDVQRHACDAPASVFKIVVTHHPFIPPPGEARKGIVGRATRALEVMEECGVDVLLAGHLHRGYSDDVRTHHEAVDRAILSVQAGTATSTRRRHEPNAYNLLKIEPGRLTITVRAWTGERFAALTEKQFAKVGNEWTEQSPSLELKL